MIAESWEHVFPRKQAEVRFALDISGKDERELTVADFKSVGVLDRAGWRMAFRSEAEDVLDAIQNGNPDLLERPEEFGMRLQASAPAWEHPLGGSPLL